MPSSKVSKFESSSFLSSGKKATYDVFCGIHFLHLVYGTLGICLIVCELSDVYVRT